MANALTPCLPKPAARCSHISSTLGPDIRNNTIDDVLGEFREMYDELEETLFQKRFAEDLQGCGKRDAA
ncbi:hypothetical protein [Paraburkholderia sp. RL17-373-BIF-A]|uniref:hypothetical protein n=1 Tax=Paraburkholderia sp. RL17-373-BIF-A TaxID=3031629 RepID=UPI0038BD15ED